MDDDVLTTVSTRRADALRCAFVGDEPLVAQCADIARRAGLSVVLIATTNDLVRADAVENGVATVPSKELRAGLDSHPADVLFSVANLSIIPSDVLSRVRIGINFHDGPLPAYAGLNVPVWALLAGETNHAVTWHLMTDGVDEGDVVTDERFAIETDDTAFSLNARCYEAALASFPRVAAAVADGSLAPVPQPAGERQLFKRYDRPARLFDVTGMAADEVRGVRALDLGHRLRNTIGCVRLVVGDAVLVVEAAEIAEPSTDSAPGTIISAGPGGLRIAMNGGDVIFTRTSTPAGVELEPAGALDHLGVAIGEQLPAPPQSLVTAIAELEPVMARDEVYWLGRAASAQATVPPWEGARGASAATADVDAAGADEATIITAVATWLGRITTASKVAFSVSTSAMRGTLARTAPLSTVPTWVIDLAAAPSFERLRDVVAAELEALQRRAPLLADALGRDPRTRGHVAARPLVVVELDGDDYAAAQPGRWIEEGAAVHIVVGADRLHIAVPDDQALAERVAEQVATVLAAGRAQPDASIGALDLVGPGEMARLDAINDTDRDHDRTATIDSQFRDRVAIDRDRPALSFGGRTLSYGELDDAVATLARHLAAAGVGCGDRVGIAVPRGVDMVVGVLATLELGAAYVPLDPTYPVERLDFMVADAGIKVLLAQGATAGELARPEFQVIDPAHAEGAAGAERATVAHEPSDLAYVIYTSGSTGTPKGVMLEHRHVVNFFAAMDDVIATDPPGVWLAVTSLSFDISVLELLWTLTRGFHVVLKSDRGVPVPSASQVPTAAVSGPARPVSFSLFYFAAGEEAAADGYRLLLESARVADRNGFEAVWTPERHFHAFGGAYPNPSVTAAALAAITDNVHVRAGSVVLPLHSPIRVAEEWAVVDNLSKGRVGISFAAGWQPNDFVLNPSAFATAKEDLPRSIDTVHRLWRGETVSLPGHDGNPVDVHTLPRPVQPELPTWLTSAGSSATFERAGTLGVNLLTHLLGQSVEQLAGNVELYRNAWKAAGHSGEGRVTLMLHTYLDVDAETARERAREPMKGYLSTAVGLLRDVASAFPTFAGRGKGTDDLFKSLSPEELDQLLEVAAQRYLGTSGLFGTPAEAAEMVDTVSAIGVDEVACLIDFGVPTDDALASLDLLLEAKQLVDDRRRGTKAAPMRAPDIDPTADSVAALVDTHHVTHLQCTPSLAAMLLADPADGAALGRLRHLLLGGEALPVSLAAELRGVLTGRFTNMYGPTETTIWSLVQEVDPQPSGSIPIGGPIANTTVFVLDSDGRRLPIGSFGELHIGGESVARGYHARPELTGQRFVDRSGMGRVYATGDVVRIHPQGHVEFAGRADNQVKIRGHRIELGEIEAVLDRHPDVVQSVVVARGDAPDVRVVGFVLLRDQVDVSSDALRKHVAETLPDVMVPSVVVPLAAFPLTPNGKIDRKALPIEVDVVSGDAQRSSAPPDDDAERLVAEIWMSELERPVGRDDNFFDIGGHSLLAVKVFRRLADATSAQLALTDVFRFPTVRTFAAHLTTLADEAARPAGEAPPASTGTDRGAMRRRALARRGGPTEGDGS